MKIYNVGNVTWEKRPTFFPPKNDKPDILFSYHYPLEKKPYKVEEYQKHNVSTHPFYAHVGMSNLVFAIRETIDLQLQVH